MDTEGTQDARGTRAVPVPRPAGSRHVPPLPAHAPAPATLPPTAEWLSTPRPEAALGVWRYRHVPPRPEQQTEQASGRAMLTGLLISLLSGLLVWSLWRNGYITYLLVPLKLFTPDAWWGPGVSTRTFEGDYAITVYDGLVFAAVVVVFGRMGNWPEAIRYFVVDRRAPVRAGIAVLGAALAQLLVWAEAVPVVDPVFDLVQLVGGTTVFNADHGVLSLGLFLSYGLYVVITAAVLYPFAKIGDWLGLLRSARAARTTAPAGGPPPPPPPMDPASAPLPAEWPELRTAGLHEAADRLAAEVRAGRMNDVDCARIQHHWTLARHDPAQRAVFTDTVLRHGAAAWAHPSGARDLPERAGRHDLLTDQVRVGRCATSERNPAERRGAGAALEPAVLGTSLLAIGPPGSGKTERLIRPVVESLALQALTGRCAFVAVCAAGTQLGPDDAYDVVIRLGERDSVHDLDLYAGATDADDAASFLAEGLVGDLDGVDTRRAATALAQLLGPYRTAHGRFPSVPELVELLQGAQPALTALRAALDAAGEVAMQRELDARMRQTASAADPGLALADRLALLDRPAFAEFFGAGKRAERMLALRAVARYPLRVRVDLPERRHDEAARLLARLVLAQFTWAAAAHTDRTHFICLVLDDATRALTAQTVRSIQRLRSVNAGVVLALRTIGDVPEALHGALHSAVGCRMAFSGVTTWDGRRFSEAWGTQWVETTEVAKHTVFADQPMTRAIHALRKLVTGRDVTTDAVTVRKVERERWSASELAHELPPGHAVLSLTAVDGEYAPPVLVDLRE